MESKNIQRYTSTYIHNALNNMKRLLKAQQDIEFIDSIMDKNSSFIQEQNSRRTKDSHPVLHFTAYELLVDFRNFMENYERFLSEEGYIGDFRNTDIKNQFYARLASEYQYFLNILPPKEKTHTQNVSEKKTLRQIRNADAHGDIEIVLDGWGSGKTILRFKVNTKNIQMIEIKEQDFIRLVSSLYSRTYNEMDISDIFLLNKEKTYELSRAITTEDELIDFLEKRYILTVNIKGQKKEPRKQNKGNKEWLTEDEKQESHEEKIVRLLLLTDDRSCCTNEDITTRNRDKDIKITDIKEIDDEDKKCIIDFIRNNPGFYTERVDIQRNLIAEVLRRKYIPKEKCELARITKMLSIFNKPIQYFERKNMEYFENDIERQFAILSKIVFLTNKEKLFDDRIDYSEIDISSVDIRYIANADSSTIQEQFFRRLRNSLTHYRYRILGDEKDGLNRKVHLWDEDKTGITFDANVDLKECIKIIMEMEFLKQISDKHKEQGDEETQYSETNSEEFDCINIAKNPKQFRYLDIDKRNNKKIIESAIESDRSILLYIGNQIEEDREYLKDILLRYPDAIIYLKKYKNDEEFVRIALAADGYLLDCVNDKYKQEEEFVLLALESCKDRMVLYDVPMNIVYKREFIRKAILIDPLAIGITSPENMDDEELAMLAVKGNGLAIRCISLRLQKDKKIALEAIRQNICVKYYISKELYDDPDFCAEVEKIEKQHELEIVKAQEIEELSENVGIDPKNEAEQFMHNIKNIGRGEPKVE